MLLTETVLRKTVLDKLSFPKIIDIQPEKPIHLIACKSTANGDCLYNSALCLLVGDESLCSYFRLLTALELALNVEYYVQHPRIEETLKSENNVFSKATLFTIFLSTFGMRKWDQFQDCHEAILGKAQGL